MSKQERAERTRRALIKSAAAVFEEYGYAQARLALISTGAGVSTGALHFHFENKAAVAAPWRPRRPAPCAPPTAECGEEHAGGAPSAPPCRR